MALYTVGQVLPNGATVTEDDMTVLPDGTTVEHMVATNPDGSFNEERIVVPAAGGILANTAALHQRAHAALVTNATFLGLASPSNVQIANQVQALTRECSALIRLLLGQLDSTSGT